MKFGTSIVCASNHDDAKALREDARSYGAEGKAAYLIYPVAPAPYKRLKTMLKRIRQGGVFICNRASFVSKCPYIHAAVYNQVMARGAHVVFKEWDLDFPQIPSDAVQANLEAIFHIQRGVAAARRFVKVGRPPRNPNLPKRKDIRYLKRSFTGIPYYGWKYDPVTGKLHERQSEQEVLRFIRERMFLVSPCRLTTILNKTFLDRCRGKKWLPVTVGRIIRREQLALEQSEARRGKVCGQP